MFPGIIFWCHLALDVEKLCSVLWKLLVSPDLSSKCSDARSPGKLESTGKSEPILNFIQEAHGPWVAHLSDIATADMQMLCNIFPILSSQLTKRSSFKQFLILKKNIYGMPVNGAWSFEQTLNGGQLGFTIGTILAIFDLRVTPMLPTKFRVNWPFGSEEEAKNRFSRWLSWRPSWKFDWHDFSSFSSTSHPNVS